MTDVINEYFGVRGVRLISWVAVGADRLCISRRVCGDLAGAGTFWVDINKGMGVPDIQKAYAILFGQGLWTICGSIIAFLIGQLIDVVIFHRILKVTGERFVWFRATGFDRGLTAARQFHRPLHRLRHRPAALAHPAVPRRRHGELRLQDVRCDRADTAAVYRARRHSRLSRARRSRASAARSGGMSPWKPQIP